MIRRAAVLAIALSLGAPALACEGTRLAALVAASSPGNLVAEFDAEGVESTEGAAWQIYHGTVSGKPVNIIRTVFGEMGRREDKLVIAGPDSYAVVATDLSYSTPITDPEMRTSVTSRVVYTFCDGAVQRPDGISDGAFEEHRSQALQARRVFRSREIASYVGHVNLFR